MQTLSQQGFSPLGLVLQSMGHGILQTSMQTQEGSLGPVIPHLLLGKVACFDLFQD